MNKDDQSIKGLSAAYSAVYNRPLKYRVKGLLREYGADRLDSICTELNPDNDVPCFWLLSEIAEHYGYMKDGESTLPEIDYSGLSLG